MKIYDIKKKKTKGELPFFEGLIASANNKVFVFDYKNNFSKKNYFYRVGALGSTSKFAPKLSFFNVFLHYFKFYYKEAFLFKYNSTFKILYNFSYIQNKFYVKQKNLNVDYFKL